LESSTIINLGAARRAPSGETLTRWHPIMVQKLHREHDARQGMA
jgi:hypothetical protein